MKIFQAIVVSVISAILVGFSGLSYAQETNIVNQAQQSWGKQSSQETSLENEDVTEEFTVAESNIQQINVCLDYCAQAYKQHKEPKADKKQDVTETNVAPPSLDRTGLDKASQHLKVMHQTNTQIAENKKMPPASLTCDEKKNHDKGWQE